MITIDLTVGMFSNKKGLLFSSKSSSLQERLSCIAWSLPISLIYSAVYAANLQAIPPSLPLIVSRISFIKSPISSPSLHSYLLMIYKVFLWNSGYSSPTKTAQFSITFSGASFLPFFLPFPLCLALSRASLIMCFASCRYSNCTALIGSISFS